MRRLRKFFSNAALALHSALLLLSLSCKEELPPYHDPRDVFDGRLSGAYAISPAENALKAYFTVINSYDETLEGTALLTGRIVLTWQGDSTFRRTIGLTDANILFARHYDATSKHLRIDPGDSVRFGISWNFIADDGRDLKRLVRFHPDPTCLARYISEEPVPIIIEGTMKVFERTELIVPPPAVFRFEFVREYVNPRDC